MIKPRFIFPALAICLLTAGLTLRTAFFCTSIRHVPASSDESITILQAKQIRQGRLPLFFMGQPYLFPIESYYNAPLVRHIPRTPAGARIMSFLLGLTGMFCSLALMCRLHRGIAGLPGVLLILFPSTYLLIHQSAYSLPGYPTLLCCTGVSLLAATLVNRYPAAGLVSGLAAGLGFSTHMLMLPALAAAGLFVIISILRHAWRDLEKGILKTILRIAGNKALWLFVAGVGLGLLPVMAGMMLHGDRQSAVLAGHPIGEVLQRIWSPAIRYALPPAMGISPVLFPDNPEVDLWRYAKPVCAVIWTVIFIGGTMWSLTGMFIHRNNRSAEKKNSYNAGPFYLMVALTLAIFAFSRRADSNSFRYLLPAVWCFPFIIQHLFSAGNRTVKVIIGTLALAVIAFNAVTAVLLMQFWATPNFAARHAGLPDLEPALKYLRAKGINHCVASYGAAYRINFMTDEQITCSQPFNERFFGWPVPYKDEVDAATNVAYVLTERIRFLKPSIFDRQLKTMGFTSECATCGEFAVYSDFRRSPEIQPENRLPGEIISITASHNSSGAATLPLPEGAGWSSIIPQKEGMWIEIKLPHPMPVCRVEMAEDGCGRCMPDAIDVLAFNGMDWKTSAVGLALAHDKFTMRNGHPVYGAWTRSATWAPVVTDRLRLRIAKPIRTRAWKIKSISVYITEE